MVTVDECALETKQGRVRLLQGVKQQLSPVEDRAHAARAAATRSGDAAAAVAAAAAAATAANSTPYGRADYNGNQCEDNTHTAPARQRNQLHMVKYNCISRGLHAIPI